MTQLLPVTFVVLLLPACQTLDFYGQAIGGQWEIMRKSQPINQVISDPESGDKLRRQLTSVEGIRHFASEHLSLPGDDSYGTYADLGREHVTWVLYAAPEFSLEPKTWWYPTLGRLDYRGFFNKDDADRLARELCDEGLDVEVVGVDAYSTLGWFHDPVLNTFVDYPETSLAELIFHELTHRKLFRKGDTAFNEALATAYAEEGVRRWLRDQGRSAELLKFENLIVRREQFYDRIDATRVQLEALYASDKTAYHKRREKAAILEDLRGEFRELRRRWGGRGLESWLEQDLNNAHLISIITYQKNTGIFRQLLKDCGGDPERFFKRAAKLKLPGEEPPGR